MGLISTMAGSGITEDESMKQLFSMREARRAGHTFFRLQLNEEFIQRQDMQSEVKFNGVKSVVVYPAGRAKGGRPVFDVIVKGGPLVFVYTPDEDPMKDGWIANMLDDEEKAIYAEKGYNRDFLASHNAHAAGGMFKILDPKIKRDVAARAKKLKEIMESKVKEKQQEKEIDLQTLKDRRAVLDVEIEAAEGGDGVKDANNKTSS